MSETSALRARLIRGKGGFYTALTPDGSEVTLRCKKKFRHRGMSPLIGDEIEYLPGREGEDGWLDGILPRKSSFIRPPVSNVTLMLIVVAPVPAPDWLLVDRLLVQARRQDIRLMLVVTKTDLDASWAENIRRCYAGAELAVIETAAVSGLGLDALRSALRGETACLAGQSGVGKTTLLNAVLGIDRETGEISRKIERGKNTTREAELLIRPDFAIFDTAGFSLLEPEAGMNPNELRLSYPEFEEYEGCCRFTPCTHDHEPGCAVSAAVAEGRVAAERWERYRELLHELQTAWRERYD